MTFANRHVFSFTDQEVRDLVKALVAAQEELCVGPGFPEGTKAFADWQKLIDMLTSDVVPDTTP